MKRTKLKAVRKDYLDIEKDNEVGELYLTKNVECDLSYFFV